jgi:hypothetical protein
VPDIQDAEAPVGAIVAELRALRAPPTELRALPVSALDPSEKIDRRAAERLERLHRDQLRTSGEGKREREARERERPWMPSERWTLRKRLWRERRDHERTLIDTRDAALAAQERELAEQRATYVRWIDELQALDPQQAAWCAELRAELAEGAPLAADIAALWRRRRDAALAAAAPLREHPALWANLPTRPGGATNAARALWPALKQLDSQGALGAPLTPLLAAALVASLAEAR